MKPKNPIFTFSIIVFLFGLFIFFFIYGFWGIGAILWLYVVYTILVLVSFLLKKFKVAKRQRIEWTLIIIYVLSHTLYYLHWDVGSEIYFDNNEKPFVGQNQNFIIVFGTENQPELENNYFTNNKIHIPENGILLTSSKKTDFKQRYRFPVTGTGEKFTTTYYETFNCYGKENFKFDYVVGAINDKGEVDYKFRDSIADIICNKFNNGDLTNDLPKGYEKGTYLDQKEIFINNANMTKFPNGLLELQNIEYLNIHSNRLGKIPKTILQFPKLKRLTIGFNGIKNIPDWIGTIESLESLAVNGNELTELSDTLLTLPKLNYLLIRENKFDKSKIIEIVKPYENKGITVQYE